MRITDDTAAHYKITYWGPGLSGKRTNLEQIMGRWIGHRSTWPNVVFSSEFGRVVYCPVEAKGVTLDGRSVHLHLHLVSGMVFPPYPSYQAVLEGADAIIAVWDSTPDRHEANLESLEWLMDFTVPPSTAVDPRVLVHQYNKRDLPDAFELRPLDEQLNPTGGPAFPAVATAGQGVWESLQAAIDALIARDS